MATIIPVGQPRNDAERKAIDYLRNNLPVTCAVIHNFEIVNDKEILEIDLAVLTPHCIYVVDVKGVRGLVEVFGSKWYPEGREPYGSPLSKARLNAKILKGMLTTAYPRADMQRVYVRAAILLTASDVNFVDHEGKDGSDVVRLQRCLPYFLNKTNVPPGMSTDIRPLLSQVQHTIRGKARPASPLIYRDWQVEEQLGGNERYTEYRAHHLFTGKRSSVRLRVYRADPYQDEEARKREQKVISNAFRAIGSVPGHPNILNVHNFFEGEDGSYFVLVTEDARGYVLRMHIKKPALALTFDQKIRIIRDVLTALEYAHSYQVIHRNLTPDAVIVSADGHARLTSFEYARAGANGTSSIARDVVDDIDQNYQAPECYKDPSQASVASDLFSAGLVFYELLTGETAFSSPTQIYDTAAIFPVKPTELKPDLPPALNDWLQKLCAFEPHKRFACATDALKALQQAITPVMPTQPNQDSQLHPIAQPPTLAQVQDKRNLPREYVLGDRFVVQEKLGQGGFATAYKVFDSFAEVMRVLKLVLTDRISVYQRLRQEYKTLDALPEHPYVVKVIWADRLADDTPYIVFEYVDGLDVEELVSDRALSVEDAVTIAMQVAQGLAHLHRHGVYHQDIKPSNLLWTDQGVRIIDFNVAISDRNDVHMPGGTGRYIPPDLEGIIDLSTAQKIDRDIYALGITLYECVTGRYPFKEPNIRKSPIPLDSFEGCKDLHPDFIALMLKAISPLAEQRFLSASQFVTALNALPALRIAAEPMVSEVVHGVEKTDSQLLSKPNYNPYVSYLLTLYSQSQRTNAGTRGLDSAGEQTYIPTLLDTALRPSILQGDFQLVIISGNAGDGKTAFIQQIARDVEHLGQQVHYQVNGFTFELNGRTFLSNYDGSQDEDAKTNDEVLLEFFAPFHGSDETSWPAHETRLIAINEGRLVDFVTEHQNRFPRLVEIVREGLDNTAASGRVAVINLNLRAIVADQHGLNDSIFDRQLRRMTDARFWKPCANCDLKDRCYIYHNAHTFIDPVAGAKTIERLKVLYTITHLRGQLHITLRDLRSALAYMLVGTRDCDDVHSLYQAGTATAMQQILDGFYFNSWMSGTQPSKDRLISLLREIDIGEVSNPELDRSFDFLEPTAREMARFSYTGRGQYDDALLKKTFEQVPREYTEKSRGRSIERHRSYVAMLRRRHYFECRDDNWQRMRPYRYFEDFRALIMKESDPAAKVQLLLQAINRGEGLIDPARLKDSLALRVRRVEKGTIQSYRLFASNAFSLSLRDTGDSTRFIEYLPQAIYLHYQPATNQEHKAELRINLDIYEMLMRLNDGYRPSPEELQGFYLSLTIFKNVLASAPYQEVMLTETGHDFFRISRSIDGKLTLERVQ
jgi:serine/threonine protein kinase